MDKQIFFRFLLSAALPLLAYKLSFLKKSMVGILRMPILRSGMRIFINVQLDYLYSIGVIGSQLVNYW